MACRAVDPNHLNLGKAYTLDMMAGRECFEVFSINCYDFDPTRDIDFVRNADVDLPILLDESGPAGHWPQGREELGGARRHVAVLRGEGGLLSLRRGCPLVPCNDQFCLGCYDAENYQIGVVDISLQPYPGLMAAVYETSKMLYVVKTARRHPTAATQVHTDDRLLTAGYTGSMTIRWGRSSS